MKYSELIQFDPIETVVILKEANDEADATRLVKTFVISKRMADVLANQFFAHLRFDKPADNKGLLVVGNYGTGKSHLMAAISAVAERQGLAAKLTNTAVAEAANAIAGKFKVIRAEIGATKMSLRDIVCGVLEEGLEELGVDFRFPSDKDRHENKTAFAEMMAAFQAKFPKLGLLLTLDELLDFLRSRDDQELSLDLSFLREVGELCHGSRFRFVAGVQESLFDNDRFQFVADTLHRVQARFEQIHIVKQDVEFVVGERLLKKTPEQQARVREHLVKFAPLYGTMTEKLEDFVRLFPVHPAYFDTFERLRVAEKREVLKTLSGAIRKLLNKEVPAEDPGVIAYDSYWGVILDTPSFRSDPDIKEVADKSIALEARIQQAFTKPTYKPAALRIIRALSVHRLTHGDIYTPMGATPEELRDNLCLVIPAPEREAGFLRTLVETTLKEILRTVAGQYVSCNAENGQYYLDLKKDIDFDALIEKRAASLADHQLDRYYFDALRRVVLENPGLAPYVPGYNIWEYEVEWRERKVGRSGYLFFGAPNQRSTAQPARDFYVYFLQPYDPPPFTDERKADEVFFRLTRRDDDFDRHVRLYAAAKELAGTASGTNKTTYNEKGDGHLKQLVAWLRANAPTAVEVTHQGKSAALAETVRGKLPQSPSLRDYVNVASSLKLGPWFLDRSPDYPTFGVLVTRENREQSIQEALRWIGGGVKSRVGAAVLDALDLLDGDQLRPRESRYAKPVLELLSQKGQGQVLNRGELVSSESGLEYWTRFRLEPEFLVVVLAALIHSGDIVLSLPGKKLDAAALDQLAKLPPAELVAFKHIERPRDLPLAALQELCDVLGVPQGLMVNPATRDDAVAKIQQRATELLNQVVQATGRLQELVFWGKPILSEQELAERKGRLATFKEFLEKLQPFNTVGKLKNFSHSPEAVKQQRAGVQLVGEIGELSSLVQQLAPLTAYLGKAEALIDASSPWQDQVRRRREDLLARVANPTLRADPAFIREVAQALGQDKADYIALYSKGHERARLNATDDKRKGQLSRDPRLTLLRKLTRIEMMAAQQFREAENRLLALKTCFTLTPAELDQDPLCRHCTFRPADLAPGSPSGAALTQVDEGLDRMVNEWTKSLLTNLDDPTVAANLELVADATAKRELKQFVKKKELPEPLSDQFVTALQDVLSGLEKVVVAPTALRAALTQGGQPCTIAELEDRFSRYIETITLGKNKTKVRIVLDGKDA